MKQRQIFVFVGLEMMHILTAKRLYELRVDLERFNGDRAYAKYSTFSVGAEVTKYKLNVGGYSGTAGIYVMYFVSAY
jgi:ficolin